MNVTAVKDPIILLVDDSEMDALLMRTVFQRVGFPHPLQYVDSGDKAISYLRGDSLYCDRQQFPLPTVVLLDLNMPRKDGFEVLSWIRQQHGLARLPVYILSASNRPTDIAKAHEVGANGYLVKPSSLDQLTQMVTGFVACFERGHVTHPSDLAFSNELIDYSRFASMTDNESILRGVT